MNLLPGSAGEVRALAARFPSATVLTGSEARAGRLRDLASHDALARYGLVHIAAHTEIDPARVLESAFVLAPDTVGGHAGSRLAAREIVERWRLDADLVCLAACQTTVGLRSQSEGLMGLQMAFLAAGARALLVTLWPVDDEATARLMHEFYSRLTDPARPMSAVDALREAEHALRTWQAPDGSRPYAHPVYWGGFVLIGDAG
jgi:CHAT domain-containing protein